LPSSIPLALKSALNELRRVRSLKPNGDDWAAHADWREQMATVLESLADVLLYEGDRRQARAEARTAREQATAIRAQHSS
jgi:hypothetical protein